MPRRRSVSRILCSAYLTRSGDHSSGREITLTLKRPTRKRATQGLRRLRRTTFLNASLFGLAPQGVCLAEHVATHAGDAFTSPFHHRPRRRARISNLRFEIRARPVRAVYSLLHYSVGSPRLAVSQPAVLWCSDFPPLVGATSKRRQRFEAPPTRGGHPVNSANSPESIADEDNVWSTVESNGLGEIRNK